eukprot:TRINITY_DN23203_c0_g1_i3.p1 TRINITY_DN23203_c0_g1~~TRINITY_DN23203_c0_g1_i3.p1  ORF type:complete len:597 (-),score=75.44 TRINITY_DN23203_c0_g1_i3:176-1966(-)
MQTRVDGTAGDQSAIALGRLCAGLCCSLGTYALYAYLYYSIKVVPPLYYGISYNVYNKFADPSPYSAGRYYLGLFKDFKLFPGFVQNIDFASEDRITRSSHRHRPLETRTSDGLSLTLQIALQYKIEMDDILDIYGMFNQDYEHNFVNTVRDAVLKASSNYEAKDFWLRREDVGDELVRIARRELRKLKASCWGLQLMTVSMPEEFEHSILGTQVQKQLVHTRHNEQLAATVRAETDVISSGFKRQVKVLLAEGMANATIIKKEAAARASQNSIEYEASVLTTIGSGLSLNAMQLVEYQWMTSLDEVSNATILSGFENVRIISRKRQKRRQLGKGWQRLRARPKVAVQLYPYDPEAWARRVPHHSHRCLHGQSQSPVQLPICTATPQHRPPLSVGWARAPMVIERHGSSLRLRFSGSHSGGRMEVGGVRYTLQYCDFHVGSEHSLGAVHLQMELECLHSKDAAPSHRGVLSFLFKFGVRGDPFLQDVLRLLPEKGSDKGRQGHMNVQQLLQPVDHHHYWSYAGSLTVPPCSEDVDWFVLMDMPSISQEQLTAISQALGVGIAPGSPGNIRPSQLLHGRTIDGCSDAAAKAGPAIVT